MPVISRGCNIPPLDGARGLAAATVAISHFSNPTNFLGNIFGDGAGVVGVMLFFALSGFLMGHLYLAGPLSLQTLRYFVVARIGRVFPLFYLVILVALTIHQLDENIWPEWPFTVETFRSHALLISGYSVFWTIPVEIHFYGAFLLFLVLHLVLLQLPGGQRIVPCLIIAAALYFSAQNMLNREALTNDFGSTAHVFLLGVVAAMICRHIVQSGPFLSGALFVVGFAAFLAAMPNIYAFVFGVNHEFFGDPVIVLFVLAFVFFSAMNSRLANLILAARVPRFLGDISYSMYLLHLPILWFVLEMLPEIGLAGKGGVWYEPRIIVTFAIYAALVCAVSYLSYRFAEVPLRQAIRRFGAGNHA